MTTCFPSHFTFGEIDPQTLPPLPSGWSYKFHIEDFGFIIGPNGDRYYLQLDGSKVWGIRVKKAAFWDFIRTLGRLKIGSDYCDDSVKTYPWLEFGSKSIEQYVREI